MEGTLQLPEPVTGTLKTFLVVVLWVKNDTLAHQLDILSLATLRTLICPRRALCMIAESGRLMTISNSNNSKSSSSDDNAVVPTLPFRTWQWFPRSSYSMTTACQIGTSDPVPGIHSSHIRCH